MIKLLLVDKSNRKYKRFKAIFDIDGKIKQVHFGSKGSQTFIDHHDKNKKRNFIKRHFNNLYKFHNDPLAPVNLSTFILWNKPTLEKSVKSYKKMFNV